MARTRRTRMLGALILGLGGCAILLGLGTWQVQRHFWKQDLLAAMEARLEQPPVALPRAPDPARDRFLAVALSGTFDTAEIAVMASRRGDGPGYRIVTAFETDDGRRILVDRGFIPAARRPDPRPPIPAQLIGNLHWPEEVDRFTPPPDVPAGLWFARDLPSMASALGTEPVLVVLRASDEARPAASAMPLDTSGVPDNHANYAVTWFLLAAAWAGMTVFLLWRIRQQPE